LTSVNVLFISSIYYFYRFGFSFKKLQYNNPDTKHCHCIFNLNQLFFLIIPHHIKVIWLFTLYQWGQKDHANI